MSKWKDTSNHWSKTSKRKEVLAKVIVTLKADNWIGKRRDPNTMAKLQQGREKYISENKNTDKYKKSRIRATRGLIGNKHAVGNIPWNRGIEFDAMKGNKNPNWKGGISVINRNERELAMMTVQYKEWRRLIFKRDNFKCKIADKNCKGQLEAHHILSWRDFVELRYEINNGITLCHYHHPIKKSEEARLSPFFQELISLSK